MARNTSFCVIWFFCVGIPAVWGWGVQEISVSEERYTETHFLLDKYIHSTLKKGRDANTTIIGSAVILVAESDKNMSLPKNFSAVLKKKRGTKVLVRVPFISYSPTQYYALMPFPAHLILGDYVIETSVPENELAQYTHTQPQTAHINITVQGRRFEEEYVVLNRELEKRKTSPPSLQVVAEAKEIWRVTGEVDKEGLYSLGEFILPIENYKYLTGMFSDGRVYTNMRGEKISELRHGGIDIAAKVNTPVFVSATGKVVLAKKRIITGNSVVVEHFPGVYSMYYHMRQIYVSQGKVIAKGTKIGTVGTTGFSTGPHLHWELRVHNQRVDPLLFMERLDRMSTLVVKFK